MRTSSSMLPKTSGLYHHYNTGDFLDCFAVEAHTDGKSMSEVAEIMFGKPPKVFDWLMALRNQITARLKLKSMHMGPDEALDKNAGMFRLYSQTDDEIIFGEDDTHLDFRISLSRTGTTLRIATWVHENNRLGTCYLWIVRPFHYVFSRWFLARAAKALAKA